MPRPIHSTVALCALVAAAGAKAQQPPAPVRTAAAQKREVRRHERVTGSLHAAREVVLAALEEGALVELDAREGTAVEKGQVLARTDARRLVAELRSARAEHTRSNAQRAQQQAEVDNAESDLTAVAAAAAENAVSQRELRNAKTRVEVAKAALAAIDGELESLAGRIELLEVRRQDTELRAPFDGVVIARHAEPGAWRRPGDPVLTLQSTGVVEAWLDIPERHAAVLAKLGPDALEVEVDATGSHCRPDRLRVLPRVHENARTFVLIADLHDPGLMPGMAVSAYVPTSEQAEQLLVPRDALVRRPGMLCLFAVVAKDKTRVARMVPVVELFATPDGVAIDAGGALSVGDRVVVEGNERLLDGAPLAPSPADSPGTGGGTETGGKEESR